MPGRTAAFRVRSIGSFIGRGRDPFIPGILAIKKKPLLLKKSGNGLS